MNETNFWMLAANLENADIFSLIEIICRAEIMAEDELSCVEKQYLYSIYKASIDRCISTLQRKHVAMQRVLDIDNA